MRLLGEKPPRASQVSVCLASRGPECLSSGLFKDVGETKGLQHAVTSSGHREACSLPIIKYTGSLSSSFLL